jgi:hypothetical protein
VFKKLARPLTLALAVLVGLTIYSIDRFVTDAPVSSVAVTIAERPVEVPAESVNVAASNADAIPPRYYVAYQDVYALWCETSAAAVTATMIDNSCHVTVKLGLNAYDTVYAFSEDSYALIKTTATEATYVVPNNNSKFMLWLDISNPKGLLYTRRDMLQTNCNLVGTSSIVSLYTPTPRFNYSGGCLVGHAPAFA